MPETDLTRAAWRKSTRSSGSGPCVEVATLTSVTAVRDSKDPTGPALTLAPAQWAAFIVGVRAGEFD